VPLVGRLPGGYRFTPSKDVADTIEWAKVRRIPPERWIGDGGDRAPIPPELFARVYRDYERAKTAAGLLDFEDMLVQTVELLENDAGAALWFDRARAGSAWTNIRTPTRCPSGSWNCGWASRAIWRSSATRTRRSTPSPAPRRISCWDSPGGIRGTHVVTLADNYRSSPQILELANRLVAGASGGAGGAARAALRTTLPDGPRPSIRPSPMPRPSCATSWPGFGPSRRPAWPRPRRPCSSE
jgi:DNA helicase-2/ATP-dependent DNA helicase PcrA